MKRASFIFLMLGCAIAAAGGCLSPRPLPFAKAGTPTSPDSPPAAVRLPTPDLPAPAVSANASAAPDMTGVLDKLEQVRAMDPAAEQKLLAELRQVPADSWPLVAEQFRASLAYHQQIAMKEPNGATPGDSPADFRRAHLDSPARDVTRTAAMARAQKQLGSMQHQFSTPIGSLADPHGASSEHSAILAQTLPDIIAKRLGEQATELSESTPPAELAAVGPMSPIGAANTSTANSAAAKTTSAEPAAFQTLAAELPHVATQALATEAAPTANRLPPVTKASKRRDGVKAPNLYNPEDDEDWQQLVKQAADELSREVVSSPSTTAEVHQHVSLRMLQLLSGDTEKALEPIPHISPAEQDYWSRQIFALATYLDHHSQPDDKRRAATSVVHLDEAVSHLRELGSLSLRNLSFCKNVFGYGAIEPYDSDVFTSGQQVSLYVEVENYHSTSNEKGYCTSLGATYELLDEKGKRVSGGDFPDVEDCCRSRRRDFHIQFGLGMPANITPGRYRVEVVVKDRQSDKIGHATASFEVRSSGSGNAKK